MPFTGVIHAARLRGRFDNFHTTDRFPEDAANGTLPNYSFIEPNLIHGPVDARGPLCERLLPAAVHREHTYRISDRERDPGANPRVQPELA
jgi:hypothetical protein